MIDGWMVHTAVGQQSEKSKHSYRKILQFFPLNLSPNKNNLIKFKMKNEHNNDAKFSFT